MKESDHLELAWGDILRSDHIYLMTDQYSNVRETQYTNAYGFGHMTDFSHTLFGKGDEIWAKYWFY